jgi:diaminopropionate ammonia-lyase
MILPEPFRLVINPRHGVPGVVVLPEAGFRRARDEIRGWPGYAPAPPVAIPEVATAAGIGSLYVSDDGPGTAPAGFAAIGSTYGLARLLRAELARRGVNTAGAAQLFNKAQAENLRGIAIACPARAGQGEAVASAAERFGVPCVVFARSGTQQASIDAMSARGAEIRIVQDGEEAYASQVAAEKGWLLVSDGANPGYTEVPRDMMQGYRVVADEILASLPAKPSHIFVSGRPDAVAAAVAVQARSRFGTLPTLVVVEPVGEAALLSAADSDALSQPLTPMAAAPSLLAWQELGRSAFAFAAVPPASAGPDVLGGLLLAAAEPAARDALELDARSTVLAFAGGGCRQAAARASVTVASPELHGTPKPLS